MLDPLRTDRSAIAPLAGFGPIERTAAGFRATTEAVHAAEDGVGLRVADASSLARGLDA